MTELTFVRHGQASFGAADYDVLSETGRTQSRLLGEWLASHPQHDFDAVACGSLLRHRDTLGGIREAYAAVGRALPDPLILPSLNEFDHRAVFGAYAQTHADHPIAIAAEHGRSQDPRAVGRFLREALLAWTRGVLDPHVPEAWPVFGERVRGAVAGLLAQAGAPRRILVVTSGGVMSQLAKQALGAPDAAVVELNLSVRNSALAEFRANDGGLSMSSWNGVPHLAAASQRALWTLY